MSQLPLSLVETHDLQQCESIIKKGQVTFFEVGVALLEIRDRKLFRAKYESFEDYCIHRWGWTRQRGYQLVEAAQIAKAVQPVPVGNERIARELSKVPDEDLQDVAKALDASEEGLTRKAVRDHLKRYVGMGGKTLDQGRYPIPRNLLAMWARRREIQSFMQTISALKCHLQDARAAEDPLFMKLDQSVIEKLEAIFHALREAKPAFVCGICQGRLEVNGGFCKACGNTGFMSEYEYETFVPLEVRQLRRKEARTPYGTP